ncbi:MAG: methyltransferase domain-containing protein [Planctomycetota bacterium]
MPIREAWHFLRNAIRDYHATGAILPSSRALARAITERIVAGPPARRVLEAGPGTGPFTRAIARRLGPEDRLDLFEVGEGFVRYLRKMLRTDPHFDATRDRIRVVHGPVETATETGVYDHIVCGIPFNNLETRQVRAIFRTFRRVLKPGGSVSWFEYIGLRPLRLAVSGAPERQRVRRVAAHLSWLRRRHGESTRRVLANAPPARVHHIRF